MQTLNCLIDWFLFNVKQINQVLVKIQIAACKTSENVAGI